jgi:tetratricopeptide (TPR) repeat protein
MAGLSPRDAPVAPVANQAKTPPQPHPHRRPRLLLLLATVVVVLPFVLWIAGIATALLNDAAATAISRRDYESAETWLKTLAKLRSGNVETVFLSARLARKELRLAEVPERLKQYMDLGGSRELARREYLLLEAQSGRLQAVQEELHQLLMQESPDGAEICEAYVNGAVMTGAIQLALTIIPVWKQSWPADPQPCYAHARILEYQQNTEGALAELDAAIQRSPRHWPSLYARSRLLAGVGRQEEALRDAQATAGMRANAAALLQQARCLLNLGRPGEARSLLQQILGAPPEAIRHSFNLVCEPERGLPVQAELGLAEAALGNAAAAVDWFDQVLSHDPNQLNVRYQRALSLRELGRNTEAATELAEVQQIREKLREIDGLADVINDHPEEARVAERCRIGELFLHYDDARRGEFWLRDALNHQPDYAPAHQLLADYYARLSAQQPEYRLLAERHRQALAEITTQQNNSPGSGGDKSNGGK